MIEEAYLTLLWFPILEQLFLKTKKVKIKLFDYTVSAFNYYSFQSLLIEIFINKSYLFKSAKPDPFILDCGANIGMATLLFKKLYPNAIINCFEPKSCNI